MMNERAALVEWILSQLTSNDARVLRTCFLEGRSPDETPARRRNRIAALRNARAVVEAAV